MRDSDRMRALVAEIVTPRPQDIRAAIRQVEGFNAKFAVLITAGSGRWPALMSSARLR